MSVPAVPDRGVLDDLARTIHEQYKIGQEHYARSVDASLVMGHAINRARELHSSDQSYGIWFKRQEFPFSRQWAWTLREAAVNEPAVLEAVASQLATGKQANIEKAVKAAREPSERSEPSRSKREPKEDAHLLAEARAFLQLDADEVVQTRRAEVVATVPEIEAQLIQFKGALRRSDPVPKEGS